jgi:hypothetical protein
MGRVRDLWVDITTLGSDLCSTNTHTAGQFTDGRATGRFRISAVSGSRVFLLNGADNAVFDLTSDTFTN